MAIQPPSDIVLDVAGAADPAKVRAATARLEKLAADPTAVDKGFGTALAAAAKAGGNSAASPASTSTAAPVQTADAGTLKRAPSPHTDAYQKFEAVLLQNFVESILPKDDDLYGGKDSAGAFRSMMAEQLANQIAKSGGIGIAKAVEHAHPAHAAPPRLLDSTAKA